MLAGTEVGHDCSVSPCKHLIFSLCVQQPDDPTETVPPLRVSYKPQRIAPKFEVLPRLLPLACALISVLMLLFSAVVGVQGSVVQLFKEKISCSMANQTVCCALL